MSGYYAANPHYAPDDFSEEAERLERCEAEAMRSFRSATKEALQEHSRTMVDIAPYYRTPKYDRLRQAAKQKYEIVSKPAWALYQKTVAELMATGEMSEALAYEWDHLAVAAIMQVAAE